MPSSLKIVGYADEWTRRPGETIKLHVSCREPSWRLSLLRLRHGDDNPDGPGFKADTMPTGLPERLPGVWHDVPSGSYGVIDAAADLFAAATFSFAIWVFPTKPGGGRQTILARGGDTRGEDGGDAPGGLRIFLDSTGVVRLALGHMEWRGKNPLVSHQWYLLVLRVDGRAGSVALDAIPQTPWPGVVRREHIEGRHKGRQPLSGPAFFAANLQEGAPGAYFNGKLDSPQIYDHCLSEDEILALAQDAAPCPPSLYWDFAQEHAGLAVPDNHGANILQLMRMPTRAVTGHRAHGKALSPREDPACYSAIHFHEDDKDDAAWPEALQFRIPEDWESGIYAFHLQAADEEYFVSFFLLPKAGRPTHAVAFLVPTFSYICYGNMHTSHALPAQEVLDVLPQTLSPQMHYVFEQRLNSTYDVHTDGSGVTHISRRLPQPHVSPKYIWGNGSPHQLNADLHLVDWLHEKGFAHDVLTDEALHEEGQDLLSPYRVILTGTHPEYWSGAMLDALQGYLKAGGHVMYMGGNGFYWVTSVHPGARHVLEVRKYGGTRTWTADPEERHHATTGEQGGLWRDRGRTPHKTLGVGFAGQGYATNAPYERTADSFSGPYAFLFAGIESETIGDTPSLVMGENAAGFEVDRVDYQLGSPPNTVVLAKSRPLGALYNLAYEEAMAYMLPKQLGPINDKLYANIAFLAYPGGGSVFSTGSISYCGSLSYNAYDNAISQLTENVLNHMLGA